MEISSEYLQDMFWCKNTVIVTKFHGPNVLKKKKKKKWHMETVHKWYANTGIDIPPITEFFLKDFKDLYVLKY